MVQCGAVVGGGSCGGGGGENRLVCLKKCV